MHRLTCMLLGLWALLFAVSSQSLVHGFASPSACPAGECSVYLPMTQAAGEELKIGLVTDTGGIDDVGLNRSAWQGVLKAEAELGVNGAYLESESMGDFAPHIDLFISQGTDLIVTVGFLMGDATFAAAQAHPEQLFSIVDYAYDPTLPNLLGQLFNAEEAAFLAGYLAAGMTQTGAVATFGGMQIPPVTIYMDGYFQGVAYYNQENGASVQVLGWDAATQTGEFTGDFSDPAAGKAMGEKFLGLGADIIFPVAGPTGLGAAQAVQEQGDAWVIGVDSDWTLTAPEYKDVVLTSAMKNAWATTYAVINLVDQDSFTGGAYYGDLANQGVGLGAIDPSVPEDLLTQVEQVKAGIIDGTIIVTP